MQINSESPDWIIARAQSMQGNHGRYMRHPSSGIPTRAALYIAFLSACSVHLYLAGRWCRSSTSSSTPRGKPLNPVDRNSLFGPTITQPTPRLRSLLQWAISRARLIQRESQFSSDLLAWKSAWLIFLVFSNRFLPQPKSRHPVRRLGRSFNGCGPEMPLSRLLK